MWLAILHTYSTVLCVLCVLHMSQCVLCMLELGNERNNGDIFPNDDRVISNFDIVLIVINVIIIAHIRL